ncbi:MAG: PilZ domain-containing protein [Acidobacteria bacterium]|nr:PilZ domain-containing protein [Acidobacteriota bacterium]MCA1642400.1 PilZ domain-containing protein [Acidobacteriota bacterium]
MDEEVKESNAERRAQRPRSPRVPVNFAVGLEGSTREGKAYKVQATAVRVSRGGATLITDAGASVGDRVRVTPPFGNALDAEVNGVWLDAEDGTQRVGVKLLDPHGWFAE